VNGSNKEEAVTHGNFAWHELYTRDVEAAKAFHAATVGWTFEGMPMPEQNRTYWVAKAGDKPSPASSTCAELFPIPIHRTG
jgi:predicted enzyme related to lactoylglutathione lyase